MLYSVYSLVWIFFIVTSNLLGIKCDINFFLNFRKRYNSKKNKEKIFFYHNHCTYSSYLFKILVDSTLSLMAFTAKFKILLVNTPLYTYIFVLCYIINPIAFILLQFHEEINHYKIVGCQYSFSLCLGTGTNYKNSKFE